ncbi:MAG: TraR/DksA C4-type zinc finger protein [Candidatus Omnitrophica bacterium]|nr:TraR/DksA C4-type zinc finger protein [Candidatus Omnitrophota bacterium]
MEELSKKDKQKLIDKNRKRFTQKELDGYKQILLEIKSKISGELRHLEEDSLNRSQRDAAGDLSGYSLHMADVASDNFDRELVLGLASKEQDLLNLIQQALHKLDEGTFGLCEKTYKPITKKRLSVMPYARLCLEAQEQEEKERQQS